MATVTDEKMFSEKASSLSDNGKGETTHVEKVDKVESDSGFDDSIEHTKPAAIVWMITACVAMGGFLFGT